MTHSGVTAFDNIFLAEENESEAFRASVAHIKSGGIRSEEDEMVWNLYYLEVFLELANRYGKEIGYDPQGLRYLNAAFEDVKLAMRFLMLGYYNTAGIHMRGFFEKTVHSTMLLFIATGKIDKSFAFQEDGRRKMVSTDGKIQECFRKGQLSCKNLENSDKDVYDEYYLVPALLAKVYQHFSLAFVHEGVSNSEARFDARQFKRTLFLYKVTQIYLARFIKVTIGESVEKFWMEPMLKQLDDHGHYAPYLRKFFGEGGFISNQFSYVYNLIHDDPEIKDFVLNELEIDLNNLFSKQYLKGIARHNRLWKKAKGDKGKYFDLLELETENENGGGLSI